MKYFSLNDRSFKVNFKEAVLMGQAPGKSLFYPESIPKISADFLKDLRSYSNAAIALKVIKPFVSDSIPDKELEQIVQRTVSFDFPLIQLDDDIFCLELFHGPTCAFKDVGATFMSGCLNYFLKDQKNKTTILVATSGDTGGAVADAFYGSETIDVIILFPEGKVSEWQELQLTTYGKNITAIEVEGSFDDCQALVKNAFNDQLLSKYYSFNSANSINIARWLSQQFYYFFALKDWKEKRAPVISVPSGNLGNLAAGLLAKKTGLNIYGFVAACNDNDTVVRYLSHGYFEKKQSIPTVSNAMDVGDPSNFTRMVRLLPENKSQFAAYSFSSNETKLAIRNVYEKNKYLLDPHGAVGYLALKKELQNKAGDKGIFLETAHPAKFSDKVQPLIEKQICLPDQLKELKNKEAQKISLGKVYKEFKQLLLERI